MMWDIQLSELNYDQKEQNAVLQVLKSEWLTMGSISEEFETKFSGMLKSERIGVFVSSATAGLHLILMSLNIQKGDEVILPALTFVSDLNIVINMGAIPILADSISLENFNVSTDSILEKITDKTRAIIVVHFAGHPVEMEPLMFEASRRNISVIEDCAHSPGAAMGDKICGTIGDFSFFSFFSNKNLSTGEGGMVFARDPKKLSMIRSMRSHGMTASTLMRHEGRASSYDVETPGFNYRADEIRAALGIVQLLKLSQGNERRKQLFEHYVQHLKETSIIVPFQFTKCDHVSAYHIMPVILPENIERAEIMGNLKENKIQSSIHYPSFKGFSAFRELLKYQRTLIADEISHRELTLPLHPKMTNHDVEIVCKTLISALKK